MRSRDMALAVAVMAVWGFNFIAIHVGLAQFPPVLFCALRFGLSAFPAIFFVGRPQVPWRWVFAVAVLLGVVKFSLLFAGMASGMPSGLSALVLQSQAIFTTAFAVAFLRERVAGRQILGMVIAALGMVLVASRLGPDRPAGAFALCVASAAAWGSANIAMRKAAAPDMLRFMVWVSAVATPMLIVVSLLVEGPSADYAALRSMSFSAFGALVYIAFLSTLVGFGVWGSMIRKYGAATVAPFSMLVPFFAMASGALVLGEKVHLTDIAGGAAVIGGVLIGAFRRAQAAAPAAAPSPAAQRPETSYAARSV
ncbi:EamA family transporter [Pendulispora albinea]|uniref:EamA family transporter n=1 Tax=Pendulispora albinea TaxID=2741071 RepID=A0ABZ2LV51_9BACT